MISQFRRLILRNCTYYLHSMCKNRMARTAIIRSVESEEYLTLSFTYDNVELGIKERQYNFRRNKTENLSVVKARILANIERYGTKKRRKKQNAAVQSVEENGNFQLPISIINNEVVFSDETSCFNAFTEGSKMDIGGLVYVMKINPPMVKSISLSSNIMAGFMVYPKLEIEFSDRSHCDFSWYRSTNIVVSDKYKVFKTIQKMIMNPVKDWEKVGGKMHYVTSESDIGRQLKVVCTPKLNEDVGPVAEALSTVPVTPGPGAIPADKRHELTTSASAHGSFRVVSYNILADLYADSDFSRESIFPSCPPYALNIDYRKQLILKELMGYNADLIFLQEVDKKVFDNDLKPAFHALDMIGLLDLKGGKVAEGLVCIYRSTKFKLIDHHSIVLSDAIQSSPLYENILNAIKQNEKLEERFLKRTTALQVVVLESLERPNFYICVGNTHLYSRPDADHIRLLQAAICLTHLEQVVGLTKFKNPQSEVSIVLCGDFNSTPENAVYQYLISQYIQEDHADWSSNAEQTVKNLSLSHRFNMQSACGTPTYTNFTLGFVGCLDYIFFDQTKLEVERMIPLPSDEEIRQHSAIPSVTMPSDHIALVCDLKIMDKNVDRTIDLH